MRYLTAAQMREADRRCIHEIGIPGVVLMNNAGAAVAARLPELQRGRHNAGTPVGIVCGKGNNGGDGFVVARIALLAGYPVRLILTTPPESITGDAAVFLRAYQNLGGKIEAVTDEAEAARAVSELAGCAILVDALLGTGISGEVRGVARAAIDAWPRVPTLAVDLPSGMDADTGLPGGCCVRADITVTFQFPKLGFQNPAAAAYLGRLVVVDIGIPEACADDTGDGPRAVIS